MTFDSFVDFCYSFGDLLAEKDVKCSFLYNDDYMATVCGLGDGSVIKFLMNGRDSEVWLMVVKNDVIDDLHQHVRFVDEYHNELNELLESIKKHADLHGGIVDYPGASACGDDEGKQEDSGWVN